MRSLALSPRSRWILEKNRITERVSWLPSDFLKLFVTISQFKRPAISDNYGVWSYVIDSLRIKLSRYNSYLGEVSLAPDNLLNRNFQADLPNRKWLTNITEFQLPAGKVYLSLMIDCFNGLVVSWTISTRRDADLVNTMLDKAIRTLPDTRRALAHSDRGTHYRWPGWLPHIEGVNLRRTIPAKGCTPDNAACAGILGIWKINSYILKIGMQ